MSNGCISLAHAVSLRTTYIVTCVHHGPCSRIAKAGNHLMSPSISTPRFHQGKPIVSLGNKENNSFAWYL